MPGNSALARKGAISQAMASTASGHSIHSHRPREFLVAFLLTRGQGQAGPVPGGLQAMDARLQPAIESQPAAPEERTGAPVRLVDQPLDLAEIGALSAELDVGHEQRDLGPFGVALILLHHSLAQQDLEA